jgi:hypothetical protein
LITKGHKATVEKNKEIYQRDDAPDLATVEKNKEIYQRDDAPDLAADPLLFCSIATRGCA